MKLVAGFALIEGALAALFVATTSLLDDTATRIALYVTALTLLGGAIRWLWRNFIRPAAKIIHRTVDAVEALETLPQWREDHDKRLSDVEAEVGIVQNDVAAIRRKMGISDDDVRAIEPRRDRI